MSEPDVSRQDVAEALDRLEAGPIADHDDLNHKGSWHDCPRIMCRRNVEAWRLVRAVVATPLTIHEIAQVVQEHQDRHAAERKEPRWWHCGGADCGMEIGRAIHERLVSSLPAGKL